MRCGVLVASCGVALCGCRMLSVGRRESSVSRLRGVFSPGGCMMSRRFFGVSVCSTDEAVFEREKVCAKNSGPSNDTLLFLPFNFYRKNRIIRP
jgi:hypothetical protein